MMEKWRFLEINWLTYAETAIYRPVLMRARSEDIVPDTVSFCTFPGPSLIVTFFNDPEKDVNLRLCREKSLPVYRTIGMGAGTMGHSIAMVFARRGYEVDLVDVKEEVFHKALPLIRPAV